MVLLLSDLQNISDPVRSDGTRGHVTDGPVLAVSLKGVGTQLARTTDGLKFR